MFIGQLIYRKLIEVDLPLDEINVESARNHNGIGT